MTEQELAKARAIQVRLPVDHVRDGYPMVLVADIFAACAPTTKEDEKP